MTALTARQREVFEFIEREVARVGRPPTYRGIVREFGYSNTNSVTCHLHALARKGAIACEPKTARGITVLQREPRGIPLLSLGELRRARRGKA